MWRMYGEVSPITDEGTSPMDGRVSLPMAQPLRHASQLTAAQPRKDAQRNAVRVLDAASELIASCGAAALTMDAVAEKAGVGKGTVFRRYGNRAGLMAALMDHTEKEFQERVLTGPPPLGPGGPPLDRLLAFGDARLKLFLVHGEVMRAIGEDYGQRLIVPAQALVQTHVRILLKQLDVDGDLELLASALLAALDPGLVYFQTHHLNMPLERVAASWADLVRRVVAAPG